MSQLTFYNSLTKREEAFEPIEPGKVRFYTCGPTVYGRPHIGNYSSYIMADLIRRWLEVSGYEVTHVKNITDVGHLVADGDSGEDKVQKKATEIAKEKRGPDAQVTMEDVLGVAQMYTDEYLEDEAALNIVEAEQRPKATETIPQMITMIEKLIADGHAYETEDTIYFRVESFPEYGKLSGNTLDNLDAGARVDIEADKKHPADFALWKKCVGENEHHVLRWDSPWGPGFPGWHIECSCMSQKFLGQQIDIHTGGEDNIFPHHECEIAQSESCMNSSDVLAKHCTASSSDSVIAAGSEGAEKGARNDSYKQFVRYWVHKRHINMGEEKMSKSLGNLFTLPDVTQMGYSPQDLRYYLLSVHYRTKLKFTEKGLQDAKKARRKIVEWMEGVSNSGPGPGPESKSDPIPPARPKLRRSEGGSPDPSTFVQRFTDAMNADLNTPEALAVIFDAISQSNKNGDTDGYGDFIAIVKQAFGCFEPEEAQDILQEVQQLLKKRQAARDAKDFEESDRLRDEIKEYGYEVRDEESGQIVRPL